MSQAPIRYPDLTSALFRVEPDKRFGGVVMKPHPHMQAAIDRAYQRLSFRDQAPPQNNLRGPSGRSAGPWDRLPARAKDESPGTSTGSQGSPTGSGSPRPAPREETRPAFRSGAFSVSDEDNRPQRPPSGLFAPSRDPNENGGRHTEAGNDAVLGKLSSRSALPMRSSLDEEHDEELLDPVPMAPRVLARGLEAAPDGWVYRLEPEEDGSIALVLAPDEGGPDFNTNDRMRVHRIRDGIDPILSRMNKIHRRLASRDWKTEIRRVVFHHTPLSSERMTVETRPDGSVDLILWSPVDPDVYGDTTPPGTGGRQSDNPGTQWPAEAWVAQPSDSDHGGGEHSIHELQARTTFTDRAPALLKMMNVKNRAFWARSPR